MNKRLHDPKPSSGFTLIELLAVISIIAVMLSVAAVGIQNIDKGQATVAGISQVQALLDETRSLAVGRGTRARLCIHADQTEEKRYLRFAVVAYERISYDDEGNETGREWRVDSRGSTLPSGVYFHPEYTTQAASSIDGLGEFGSKDESIRFPGSNKTNRNPEYYFWEFNSEGLCIREDSQEPGAALVICRGQIRPNTTEPIVTGNDVAGLVVWRNGRTSPIRNTEFINNSST